MMPTPSAEQTGSLRYFSASYFTSLPALLCGVSLKTETIKR